MTVLDYDVLSAASDARRLALGQLGEEGFSSGRRNLSPFLLRRFQPELDGDQHFVQGLLFGLAEGGEAGELGNERDAALVLLAVEELSAQLDIDFIKSIYFELIRRKI